MKGKFRPKNPKKYKGNCSNIIYRSSYEFKMMSFFDLNDDIIEWQSEEFCIKYKDPVDKSRIRNYFPDFWVKYKDGRQEVIEVKPYCQTIPPKKSEKKTIRSEKRFLKEAYTFMKNQSKWTYAQDYCKKKGWEFKIVTEKDLKILKNKNK